MKAIDTLCNFDHTPLNPDHGFIRDSLSLLRNYISCVAKAMIPITGDIALHREGTKPLKEEGYNFPNLVSAMTIGPGIMFAKYFVLTESLLRLVE